MNYLRVDFEFGTLATVESAELLGASLEVTFSFPSVGPTGATGPTGPQGPAGSVSGTVAWTNITGKPSTFPPDSHTHTSAAITDFAAAVAAVSPPVDWNSLTGKPSTFAPSAHTHTISEVTSLQAALDGKAATSHTHTANQVTDFNSAAAAAAPVQSVNGNTGAVTVSVPSASTATPAALGTAAAGTATAYAREDHIHAMPTASDVGAADITHAHSVFTDISGALSEDPDGARAELGLGGAAVLNVGTTAGTVAAGDDARLSDSRTPSSHSASHASGGSDPVSPASIGAQSIFDTVSDIIPVSGALQLSAARARSVTVENSRGAARDVYLPMSGIQAGDVFVIVGGGVLNTTVTVKVPAAGGAAIIDPENTPSGSPVVISATGQQYRFIVTNPASFNPWRFVSVDTHTHPASAISDSTTAGRALLTAADAAAQRTSLGLGTAATSASSDFAAASHSHELTSLAATGATNGHVLTANGSGGVTFAAASGGGVSSVSSSASDVLDVSGANITGVDAGSDKIVFWDDSASALKYLEVSTGLSLSGTTLTATGGGGGATNLWIPASAWIPRTTGGCGVDSREIGATNRANVDELLFDTGTEEFAQALVVMPSNYNNSTLTASFYWTASSGSGGVAWGISGRAYGDDDALDQATGTRIVVTDTFITANDVHVTSATSAVTIDGTPASGKAINFQISREVGNVSDTLGVDARLLGVEILFN